ncbi:hypothetical protein LguiB_025801 [Lonicera macranthoides]
MVKIEVEILSRETIKPYSPTPSHLKTFKLSFLDQISPIVYVPIIFYYPLSTAAHHNKTEQILNRLKVSLSKTLSVFFPLAGRIRDHLSVDCNDEGVLLSEARVNCHLSEFLEQPQLELLEQFLPCSQFCMVPLQEAVQVAIQLNVFASGGIAIGACFFHKIVDGATMGAFLKCWAAIASESSSDIPEPDFLAASEQYPPREELRDGLSLLNQSWVVKNGKGVRRRFVFDATAISSLKDGLTTSNSCGANPSRVSVVASFMWKSAMAASRSALGSQHRKSSVLGFSVNMRPRLLPPLPESCFGHMVWQAVAAYKAPSNGEDKADLHAVLVSLLRESVGKLNDITGTIKGDEGFRGLSKFREEMKELFCGEEDPDAYIFTSWCKFGYNKLDFGWGKPIWVSHIGGSLDPMFVNYLMLIESASGDGLEAWVCLDERVMAILERDPDFLAFASLNPSIIAPLAH